MAFTTLFFVACNTAQTPGTDSDDNNTEEPVNPDKPQSETAFTIEVVDITATAARVTVAAKDGKGKFYFDILREEYYNNYNDRLGFQNFIDYTVASLMESNGMSKEDVLSRILSSGNDSYGFTGLEAGSVYYAVAMGVNDSGTITTDVAVVKFSTLPLYAAGYLFSFSSSSRSFNNLPSLKSLPLRAAFPRYDSLRAPPVLA